MTIFISIQSHRLLDDEREKEIAIILSLSKHIRFAKITPNLEPEFNVPYGII